MKRDPVVLIVVGMAAALMLLFGVYMSHRPATAKAAMAKGAAEPARDFTLKSLEGKTVRLSDFKGKAVLLNFWEPECEPCRIETPWLVELQKQYGPQGLQIVGVSMDNSSMSDVTDFAKEMAIDYPILVGKESETDAVGDAYGGIAFLPQTFVISRDGKIVGKILGLESRSKIEDEIKNALASGPVAHARPLLVPKFFFATSPRPGVSS